MSAVAIVGAGPYALSLAAHLAARNIPHRIFGRPMSFWSQIADAGGERYLKSYCFGTNISAPKHGSTFSDYSRPRGLETFEPCSIRDFASYGLWFQTENVPWLEPLEVEKISKSGDNFTLALETGERVSVTHLILATGLSHYAYTPSELATLPRPHAMHTAEIASFALFKGQEVAVVGGGQSALEAAALLLEAGARPQILVRQDRILWNTRVCGERSIWQRIRSPISGLGTGPKAWMLTNFPGTVHRMPARWRSVFVKSHLPPEGAWWLRDRVENRMPIHLGAKILQVRERGDRIEICFRQATNGTARRLRVDLIVAGTGYDINIDRLGYLDQDLRAAIVRYQEAPRLDAQFRSSVKGLRFIGPASAMSFGPLFRFVVGAEYTARIVSADLDFQLSMKA